ncbi:MAG: VanZ family protein [Pseudonocardia sp.]|nr:VanZ family protein [Pseudonocardia sp.]
MTQGRQPPTAWRALPFVVAAMVSLAVLFTPASGVPSGFPGSDTLVHLAVFAALALTGRRAGLPHGALVTGLVAYAIGSEVLQGLLPIGRSADPRDALADAVGIALGWALARLCAG